MQIIIRNEHLRNIAIDEVRHLHLEPPSVIRIEPYSPRRSLDQNAFLHAVPLRIISEETGHSIEDMKEYLLGEAFGWQDSKVFGHEVQRPVKRSSELTTKEFSWFLEWIESWAANTLGLILPRPNEEIT
jgi:hypothetical protein